MIKRIILFLVCLNLTILLHSQSIAINEVQYTNRTIIEDASGKTPDWIELFNNSSNPINLEGYSITDDRDEPLKWVFPSVDIASGGFLLIFASGNDEIETFPLHTNFKIKVLEEDLYLFNAEGEVIDSLLAECVPADKSIGRTPDGNGFIRVFNTPSPESSNNLSDTLVVNFEPDTLIYSHKNGFYDTPFSLELQAGNPLNTIFFTTDSKDPDDKSSIYESPISIYNRSVDKNVYSKISTSTESIKPEGKVFKSNVVRAVVYNNGCPATPVHTKSFFVSPSMGEKYPVNIISLTTDPNNLFDYDEGIYVYGADNNFVNHGRKWEREAYIEVFDTNGEVLLEQGAGIRIHGRTSRLAPQKSVRLYARESYGDSTFSYPFFKDKNIDSFRRLLLRATHSDWTQTLFKDEFCHHLVKDLNIDYMAFMPSVVFIDGEYWGIHNLRERQDEYYIESNHNINIDSLDVIEYAKMDGILVEEGDMERYNLLVDLIDNQGIETTEIYDSVKSILDIENAIDYYIAHLFLGNKDFPDLNVALWRPKTESGVFRYFFFDCDGCMTQVNYNLLPEFTKSIEDMDYYPEWSKVIFRGLLKNNEFRKQFYARFIYLLQTTFTASNVLDILDKFEKMYEPLVGEHVMRWQKPTDLQKWKDNVNKLRQFAIQRTPIMFQQLNKIFNNPFDVYPNPSDGSFFVRFYDKVNQAIDFKIYTIEGKLVFSREDVGMTDLTYSIQTNLRNGVYLLTVETPEIIFSEKLIIR